MAEEKPLYPLRFAPEESISKHWGTETYKFADLGFVDSVAVGGWLGGNTLGELMETYLERLSGETAFEWYGTQFPVHVKLLDVRGRTSLHVNAGDEAAQQRYDAFGKTAFWYVAEAGPEARLLLGFKKDISASELYGACLDGSVGDLVNVVRPKKGDGFLIPPGTVHAAQGPVKIVEISEASELFFRLCDWGRENDPETAREMHLEEAFDLIDLRQFRIAPQPPASGDVTVKLAECPQFTVTRFRLADILHVHAEPLDSFLLYTCVEGAASLHVDADGRREDYEVRAGEVLLVPAEVRDFFLLPREKGTVLLETRIAPRSEQDSYLNE